MRRYFQIYFVSILLLVPTGCSLVQKLPPQTELQSLDESNNTIAVEKAQPKIIKIGTITPLSKKTNKLGNNIVDAIEMVVEEANKSDNFQIVMVHEDGSCNYDTAKSAAKTLVEIHQVVAIIGGVCSEETLGISEISNQYKIPVVSLYSTSPKIRDKAQYVFRINGDDRAQGIYASSFTFNQLNYKNIFVAYENTEYGDSLQKAFSENFSKLGGIISTSTSFKRNSETFDNLLNQYKISPSKSMYLVAMPNDAIHLIEAAKNMDLNIDIIGTDTLQDDRINQMDMGENIKLTYITPYKNNDKYWLEFNRLFQLRYGKDPKIGAAEGYDAINLIINAILKTDEKPDSIIENLFQVKNYNGASGKISFDNTGDNMSSSWNVVTLNDFNNL